MSQFKAFVVVGLKRSGHHAVIQWLSGQIPGIVNFHNDCRWIGGTRRRLRPHDFSRLHRGRRLQDMEDVPVLERSVRGTVYSFEDLDVSEGVPKVPPLRDETGRRRIGVQPIHILVIRDPKNWLASCLAAARRKRLGERLFHPAAKLGIYRSHCQNAWRPEWCVIRFDRFVADVRYRLGLALRLRLQFTDQGLDILAPWGLSSFSGAKTYADADMDVLSRHQRFVGDKEFEALHDELVLKHKLDAVIDALEVER